MSETASTLVLASLAGDSLSLGAHWIYDPQKLADQFGRVDKLLEPQPGSFHAGKKAGDFTHYGDQTLVLLESVAACGGFDLQDFAKRWKELFADYTGYLDMATKKTLANFQAGVAPDASGSSSRDLAGASRIAPLVAALRNDPEVLEQAARAQTAMTHANPQVVEAAVYFSRVCLATLSGTPPLLALEEAAQGADISDSVASWVQAGLESAGADTVHAIQKLGPTCHVNEALPGAVHCIAKYAEDPAEGLVQCVMAGGDSAARALLVGLVLACWPGNGGLEALPGGWTSGLVQGPVIRALCERLP